jgi:hypothetical protein
MRWETEGTVTFNKQDFPNKKSTHALLLPIRIGLHNQFIIIIIIIIMGNTAGVWRWPLTSI